MKIEKYVSVDELEWAIIGWQSTNGLTDEERERLHQALTEDDCEPDYEENPSEWHKWAKGIAKKCGWKVKRSEK